MHFEWDEAKRKRNIETHGIDFDGIDSLFDGFTLTVEDDRFDYGEKRYLTVGLLNDRVVVVVHTERQDSIRIISIRKATKYEQRTYFKEFSD